MNLKISSLVLKIKKIKPYLYIAHLYIHKIGLILKMLIDPNGKN